MPEHDPPPTAGPTTTPPDAAAPADAPAGQPASSDRREWLQRTLAAASAWLAGHQGAEAAGLADQLVNAARELSPAARKRDAAGDPPPVGADAAEVRALLQRKPLPPRYRTAQTYLLQGVQATELPSRVAGGSPFRWDQFGPTHRWVDSHTGWAWTRPGGDWLDAQGRRHGPQPWFSVPVADASGTEQSADYFADVTRLVRQVQTGNRWLAMLWLAPTAPRSIAGLRHPRRSPPAIDVVYADGQRERLNCRIVAGLSPTSVLPVTAAFEVPLPAVLEFDRPTREVQSAKLRWTVTAHWSGRDPVIEGYLLDPPVSQAEARTGIAAGAGRLDERLAAQPSVIGVHRYLDGRPLSDFLHADGVNFGAVQLFDPAIYGLGPADTRKLPHVGLGKWHNAGPPMAVVSSRYGGEGFEPLAPGLGALRVHMPVGPKVADGAVVGSDGTLGAHAMIFLPEPQYGRLDHLFVRYYVRLGLPGTAEPRQRLHVFRTPGQDEWVSMTGKFGIGPDHSTSLGGVSGSSGGGAGWQMRLSWYECDAANGGPDERGLAPGFHLYDFQGNNPPGHRYGNDQDSQAERWGQRDGLGGMLYAGHWYCIETELKLNSVSPQAPGFRPDGALRAWVDGRLVYERTGMVFRSLPLAPSPNNPNRLPPCRELGVRGLWMNWFHGGRTPNSIDRVMFYTGLAWGTEYIGPMAL